MTLDLNLAITCWALAIVAGLAVGAARKAQRRAGQAEYRLSMSEAAFHAYRIKLAKANGEIEMLNRLLDRKTRRLDGVPQPRADNGRWQ